MFHNEKPGGLSTTGFGVFSINLAKATADQHLFVAIDLFALLVTLLRLH